MNAKSSTNASKSAKAGKTGSLKKTATKKAAAGKQSTSSKPTKKAAELSLQERIKEAKKLEAIDRADAPRARAGKAPAVAKASAAHPLRNSNFPETYIKEISVKLDDPDHALTLKWTGPQAADQDSGPFRSCPGAGSKGLNCDVVATSRRSGSKCTPKGTFAVSFQSRLNSDSRATYVTWFVRERGIALHYFPSVPKYAASHGCVRLEKKSVAQLIQSNSRIGLTNVVIDGTWTKPPKQC